MVFDFQNKSGFHFLIYATTLMGRLKNDLRFSSKFTTRGSYFSHSYAMCSCHELRNASKVGKLSLRAD